MVMRQIKSVSLPQRFISPLFHMEAGRVVEEAIKREEVKAAGPRAGSNRIFGKILLPLKSRPVYLDLTDTEEMSRML